VVGIEVFSIDPLILYTGQTLTITMNYIPKASINGTYLPLSNVYWKALIYTDRYYGYYNFPLYNGSVSNALEVKVLKMPIALGEGSYILNMTFYIKGSDVLLGSALTPPFVVKSQPSGPGPVGTPMSKLPLTVIVRDSKGSYVEGASVFVYDMYNATVWSGKTDSWGTATVTLSPGTYNVTIRYDNQTLTATVKISDEPITKEFTLPPVITIAPVTVTLDSYSILWLTLGLLGAVGAVVLERKGKTPLAVLLGLFTVGAVLHSSLVMTKQVRPWFTVPELSTIFSTLRPSKLPSLSLPDLTFLLQNFKMSVLVFGFAALGLVGAIIVVRGKAQPKRRIGRFAVPHGRVRRR